MCNVLKLFSLIAISITLQSCKDNINGIVSSLYNKKVYFNGKKQTLKSDTIIAGMDLYAPIKVVAYLNSTLCTQCIENYLSVSSKFMNHIGSDSVMYVCILQPRQFDSLQAFMSKNNLPRLSIVIDTDNKYRIQNSISMYNNMFTTFLLDSDNRIVLIGDPLRSNKVRDLYEKHISLLIHNNGKKLKRSKIRKDNLF